MSYTRISDGQASLSGLMNGFSQSPVSSAVSSGASLLSGGLGLVGGIAGAGMNMLGQYFQRRWEEKMWNLENEYNLPENQLQRFMDAGINPGAAIESILGGNGSISATAPSNPGSNVMTSDLGALFANSANSMMERALMKSQIEKTDAEAELTRSMDVEQNYKNDTFMANFEANLNKLVHEGRVQKETADALEATNRYKEENAYNNYMKDVQQVQKNAQEIQNMQQDYFNKLAEYEVLMSQADMNDAQREAIYKSIDLTDAQIAQVKAMVKNIDAQTVLTNKQVDAQVIENDIKDMARGYAQDAYDVFERTGVDLNQGVWYNALKLVREGKSEECMNMLRETWQVLQETDPDAQYAGWHAVNESVNAASNALRAVSETAFAIGSGFGRNIGSGASKRSMKEFKKASDKQIKKDISSGSYDPFQGYVSW